MTIELRASIPVVITPMVPEQVGEDLPPYQDAWRSITSHDPETLAHMIAMGEVIPPSDSYSSLSSSNSSLSDEEVTTPWMGVNISRVPSYATALRTGNIPCHASSSLPTYDSIIIV